MFGSFFCGGKIGPSTTMEIYDEWNESLAPRGMPACSHVQPYANKHAIHDEESSTT